LPHHQKSIVKLGFAILAGLPTEIIEALNMMLPLKDKMTENNKKMMTNFSIGLLNKTASPFEAMEAIFKYGASLEIPFPLTLMQFNRGRIILEQVFVENQKEIQKYDGHYSSLESQLTAEDVYYFSIVKSAIYYNFVNSLGSLNILGKRNINPLTSSVSPRDNPLSIFEMLKMVNQYRIAVQSGHTAVCLRPRLEEQNIYDVTQASSFIPKNMVLPKYHVEKYLNVLKKVLVPQTRDLGRYLSNQVIPTNENFYRNLLVLILTAYYFNYI
jgi:hypothetical protein